MSVAGKRLTISTIEQNKGQFSHDIAPKGSSSMESDTVLPWVVEWLWVPLWLAVIDIFRRLVAMKGGCDEKHAEEDKRITLLEAENVRRDQQRGEILNAIKETNETVDRHNTAVMGAISKTNQAIARLQGKVT